jgi:hypothetical protein
MQTKKLLKATEPDEVERMFLDLEQTVKHGTSVIFSFPSPGQVMVLCATSQGRAIKCGAANPKSTIGRRYRSSCIQEEHAKS